MIVAAFAAVLTWLSGLVWFASVIPTTVEDKGAVTDAIVVLTGGSGRLEEGLALLADGKAKKLFVSGVYRGVEVTELLRLAHVSPTNLKCCIVLGHSANSTFGNAAETAQWMAAERFHSLRLVTAAYHMPRSLLEFRRAIPGATIIPHPVFPERVKRDWWFWPGSAGLVINEYHKYLLAFLRRVAPETASIAPVEPAQ